MPSITSVSLRLCTALLLGAACGSSGTGDDDQPDAAATSDGAPNVDATPDAPPDPPDLSLSITPDPATMVAELFGPVTPLQFACVRNATGDVVPGATWALGTAGLGTIDASGLFTPSLQRGGATSVTCVDGAAMATTTLTVQVHALESNVTTAEEDMLRGVTGIADPSWSWLYPYDHTVFPRGIPAPQIQLTTGMGGLTQVLYVHIVTAMFEYEGFFNAATPPAVAMAGAAWDVLARTNPGAAVDVNVSKLVGGVVYGPLERSWTLADGELHGNIYYASYDSPLAGGNGAVLKVRGDSTTPQVSAGNCTTCHSVAADGTTLVAANHSGGAGTFDLTTSDINPPVVWSEAELGAYAALYPKGGEVLVVQGAPGASWPPNTPGSSFQTLSQLRQRDGTIVAGSGIELFYAQTPAFSLDGGMLAFTNRSDVMVGSYWPGTLSIMDYDNIGRTFTNYRVLATPPPGRQYSWSSFTPGNDLLLFQDGLGEDLATWNWFGGMGNTGRLVAVDPVTSTPIALDNLNGDAYVPQGARDSNKNYEPSVMPVPSGGYYWVVFTSRRTYGNALTGAEDTTKRLWVAAIDPNAPAGADPSHPAFYLSGQELTSGNHRGQWATDAPRADGSVCEFGEQCATGFCLAGACAPDDGLCSVEYNACTTATDCCDGSNSCVDGRCVRLAP